MNKVLIVVAFIVVFVIGFISANIYDSSTGGWRTASWGRAYEVSGIIGTQVKNPHGDELAKISDFLIDTNGEVSFAILSYGEKLVAVPFGIFSLDRQGKHLVLDTTKEKLDSAPTFAKDSLSDHKWAVEAYKHFGHTPYWSDGLGED